MTKFTELLERALSHGWMVSDITDEQVDLAGWVHRQQQRVIDYLRTENQVLREKLGKKRILLDDDQRRRLAVKAKLLGRKLYHTCTHGEHAGEQQSITITRPGDIWLDD